MKIRSLLLTLLVASPLFAKVPPQTPVITEPQSDGQLVSGGDVHMVTAPFVDADGDEHFCTDWEILFGEELVWTSPCAQGPEKIHIHMGDGFFVGSYAGLRELDPGLDYTLRARHRDDSGDAATEWSAWGTRTFHTSEKLPSQPMRIRDVQAAPVPRWSTDAGNVGIAADASIRLEVVDGAGLFTATGDGFLDDPALASRGAVRLVVQAGADAWNVAESELSFEDESGRTHIIYLPALALEPHAARAFWVSANGGTHEAGADDRAPSFETIVRGAPVPWAVRQRGFVVEKFASNLQLPVNMAFVPNAGDAPDSPFMYVVELYGAVKLVTRSGEVRDFAQNLLDFDPTGAIPGSGEFGTPGIVLDPESGDLFVTGVYWPDRSIREAYPRVLRIHVSDDGRTAEAIDVIVAFPGERQSSSHQISNITIGPDRKLYVHFGDAAHFEYSQDMSMVRGKILRMNFDGTPAEDNPFFDASDGITATDYIFALGFRNPFGGAWRASDRSLYEIENGPAVDRLTRVVRGRNYLWDGTNDSMHNYAIAMWQAPSAPVQIAWVQPETFGGSGFPLSKMDTLYVTESGTTWGTGVQLRGKRISEVVLAGDAFVRRAPLVEYDGTGKATVSGVAAGPGGLYFTDLYKDYGFETPIDRGANVFRIRWIGYAAFDERARSADGLTIDFADRSNVDAETSRTWDFGDGTTSTDASPRHVYATAGSYIVRLSVNGANGPLTETKKIYAGAVEPSNVSAEYFAGTTLQDLKLTREESDLDFRWGDGSPDESVPVDGFSARWRGVVVPRVSGTYHIRVRSEDRVRVKIGGETVVDAWELHDHEGEDVEPVSYEGTIELEAGREVPYVVEYAHETGSATLQVLWSSEDAPETIFPRAASLPRRRSAR